MVGWWILAILAALLALFCCVRLGVRLEIDGGAAAWVTFGPLCMQVAPAKGKKKQAKPKAEPKEPDLDKTLKSMPKITKEDLRLAWQMLWPPSKRALRRLGRGIQISPLELSVILGGRDDPAWAAEAYGLACAVIWTVMPPLEQLVDIRRPAIHVEPDYQAGGTTAQCRIGISLRVGTLIALGLGMGIPALRWLLRFHKTHKAPKPSKQTAEPAAQPPATAA